EAGSLALRRGQGGVAGSPAATCGSGEFGAFVDEIGDDVAIGALDHRALGHGDDEVLPVGTVAQIALADPPAVGAQVRTAVQRQQCGRLSVDAEDDVAAVASAGTVGGAARFALLAPAR